MAVITVRVTGELKEQMKKFRHINWSEVVRQAIIRALGQGGDANIAKAVLLNERSVIVPDEGFEGVKVIREWRSRVTWRASS